MQKGVMFVLIVLAIVVLVGGILLFSNTSPSTGTSLYGNNNPGTTAGTGTSNPTGGTGTGTGTGSGTKTSPQTHNIAIQNMAFNPNSLTISVGDSVVWTNMDSVQHTVTSTSGTELSSGQLSGTSSGGYYSSPTSGGTYSHTFMTAGTYSYHCSNHPYMTGTVIVQ